MGEGEVGKRGRGAGLRTRLPPAVPPPVSLHPPLPRPLSAQSSPVALSLVISSLEHCFTPFKHLLYVLHSTRTHLLPSFSGSQAPTSSTRYHHHLETPYAFQISCPSPGGNILHDSQFLHFLISPRLCRPALPPPRTHSLLHFSMLQAQRPSLSFRPGL